MFLSSSLRRPSSASFSLEVDCERLISRRPNWIFLGHERQNKCSDAEFMKETTMPWKKRQFQWKDRSNTIKTIREQQVGVFWWIYRKIPPMKNPPTENPPYRKSPNIKNPATKIFLTKNPSYRKSRNENTSKQKIGHWKKINFSIFVSQS